MKTNRLAILWVAFVFGAQFSSAQIASDNAGNYSLGWSNGDNQGSGFGPWVFENNNNPTNANAGAYLADPNNKGDRNTVIFAPNSSGKAFGLYANPTGAFMVAKRNFGGSNAVPLAVGESFSFKWLQFWGGGNKGINLFRGGDGDAEKVLNLRQFEDAGGNKFVVQPKNFSNSPTAITNAYNDVVTVNLRCAAPDTLVLTVQTSDPADGAYTNTFRAPSPDRVSFYFSNGSNGSNDEPLFNNLAITTNSVPVATRQIKFSVNTGVLEGQTPKKFDPASGDKVFVRGYPSGGWGDSERVELIQEPGTTVYSKTLLVAGDTGLKSGGYKFFIEKGTTSMTVVENGGYESSSDREFDLPSGDTNLPSAYFSNVLPSRNVIFAVDMGAQARAGTFALGTDKIYLVGDPTDWGNGAEMIRQGNTSIFTVTIPVFGVAGDTRLYKFKSSNPSLGDGGYEPDANPDANETARVLTLGSMNVTQTLSPVWYNNVSAFTLWSGGATLNSANVGKYAIGGASSLTATDGVQPTTTVNGGNLVLTAIVRTDDAKVSVVGEAVTSLADYAPGGTVSTVNGVDAENQAGVPAGHKRQTFTVAQGLDTRKFLRLKATLAP